MGAPTPNPRTLRILTRDAAWPFSVLSASQGAPGSCTRRPPHGFEGARSSDLSRQTGSATAHPRLSATGFSVPGKGIFRPEKNTKWRLPSDVVSAETDANEE